VGLADVEAVYRKRLMVSDFMPLKEVWNRLSPVAQRGLLAETNPTPVPSAVRRELGRLSMIEDDDPGVALPRLFQEWLAEGKAHAWLTPSS
jgi:hypothetical protein